MKFTPIELGQWPRGQMFYYFTKMAPTGYSITVNMDVTVMKKSLKERNIKFFPSYLWLATKQLNKQIEFKLAYQEDTLGYYDVLTPLYAVFHHEDKTISLMWTEYKDDFSVFYENYLLDAEQFGSNHGILCKPELPPANSYTVSCVPWIEFSHFALHSYENKSYFYPTIEAGKFIEQDEKIKMPLSITVHHAATDGWHIKQLLEDLQSSMDHPEVWLK